jgi:2-dehydropantoate 2-reductase
MRICIYGAGAVGGHLASRFAAAGEEVSLVARGANLAAIRARGLAFHSGALHRVDRLNASADPAELGKQDAVIVAVKATGLDAVASGLPALMGPETAVVFALNGIPWWYMDELSPPATPSAIARAVPLDRVLACVIHSPNTLTAPGVVHNELPSVNRFVFGELDFSLSPRCRALAESLTRGGAQGVAMAEIRGEIWRKLVGNTMMWPVACLTGGTGRQIVGDPATRMICRDLVAETLAVAHAWGVEVAFDTEGLVPAKYTDHKSSVLQDLEAGRPLELDWVAGAVQRLGSIKGIKTPLLDTLLALVRNRAARTLPLAAAAY